jgi:hypothetical protein
MHLVIVMDMDDRPSSSWLDAEARRTQFQSWSFSSRRSARLPFRSDITFFFYGRSSTQLTSTPSVLRVLQGIFNGNRTRKSNGCVRLGRPADIEMVEACPTASGAALAAQCILSGEAHYDCSSAAVYEFVLYFDGSCITRRGCHSSGWSSQQLCLKSRQLRRREPVIARQAHGRSERSRGATTQTQMCRIFSGVSVSADSLITMRCSTEIWCKRIFRANTNIRSMCVCITPLEMPEGVWIWPCPLLGTRKRNLDAPSMLPRTKN